MKKKSSFENRVRKGLSDITNLDSQNKSPLKEQKNVLPAIDDSPTKNYIEQLLKENAVMMKVIQEKDKIIQSTGLEMQKLRVSLQRTQLQNWHLAQSNSQMLAELNMAKDRLNTLQHELVCKDILFKAKTFELQEGEPKPEKATLNQPVQANDHKENKVSKTKTGRLTGSQSMGPTTSQQAVDKGISENKRPCFLKPQEPQAELFEINVASTPVPHPTDPHRVPNTEEADDIECLRKSSTNSKPQRSSVGRPQRRAAEKVQSYRDPPLNTKMRRPG